jgi:catechol 2,3-dioxygenase-like lactoylglutathione lyase family enzyme
MSEATAARQVVALKAHLALNVRNVERSTEFYKKLFGLEPSKARSGYAKFDVQNPPLNLTLNEAGFKERGALSHLGIQVAETADVLAMREQWIERGLATRDEMQTNCCYAIQDKTWASDPDGNQWEVFVVLEDNLSQTTMCCTTAAATPLKEDATATKEEAAAATAAVSSSNLSSTTLSAESSACCEPMAAGECLTEACCTTNSIEPVAVAR